MLQDDILPAKNLIETVKWLIELIPDSPISLFSATDLTTRCKLEGKHWATTDVWYGMQGYILPMDMAQDFVAWCDKYLKDDIRADDIRMATYLYQHRIKTYITAPSLVEHLAWETSTMSEGKLTKHNRVANWFIGDGDPLDIDWSEGIDEPVDQTIGRWHEFVRKYKDLNICRRK